MKAKTTILAMLSLIFHCYSFGQCSGGTYYGEHLNPSTSWQVYNCVWGGEYCTFSANSGDVYTFSFCQGGGSSSWDTQITILDNNGNYVNGYNDDNCGTSSEVTWQAFSTTTYRVLVNQFYCDTQQTCGANIAYMKCSPPNAPTEINGDSAICGNTEQTYSISPVSGATSYYWNIPSGWTIVSGQGTASIVVNANSSSGFIDVYSINSCDTSSNSAYEYIYINSPPSQPNVPNGKDSVCFGDSENYFVPQVTGATSYLWSVPSDWNITSGQGTSSINATVGESDGQVKVVANNDCGADSNSVSAISTIQPTAGYQYAKSELSLTFMDTSEHAVSWFWDFGDPSSGSFNTSTQQSPTHIFSGYGTYNVCLTVTNYCDNDTECKNIELLNVGTNEMISNKNVWVNPNPSNGMFSVTFSQINPQASVLVHNSIGQCVIEKQLDDLSTQFDMRKFPKGMYYLTIKESEHIYRKNLVIY